MVTLSVFYLSTVKKKAYIAVVLFTEWVNIYKKQVPLWLAQHPDILAFYQAPLEFGGQGTLSVLVDWQMKEDKKC